jgi:sec-independent protein translocase protein TatC
MSSNLILPFCFKAFKMWAIDDHWFEVKTMIFYLPLCFTITFITGYTYSNTLIYCFVFLFIEKFGDKRFIFNTLGEAFSTCILISFNVAIFSTLCFSLLTIYIYIKPGLYKQESKNMRRFFCLLFINFFISFFIFSYFVFPSVLTFFSYFESFSLFELTLEARIFDYVGLTLNLIYLLTIVFQIPLILPFLISMRVIRLDYLIMKRKELTFLFFVLGALLSPPELLSQLFVAVPLFFLMELLMFSLTLSAEYGRCFVESCSNGKR